MSNPFARRRLARRSFLKLSGAAAGSILLGGSGRDRVPLAAAWHTRKATSLANIVLIIVDALRADHVSANGYARSTTPNLDTWIANQGVTFLQARSTSSWTFPANAAIMTGRTPSSLGTNFLSAEFSPHVPTLAQLLHAAGYYTAGFVSAEYVRGSHGFSRGFDLFDEQAVARSTSADKLAEKVNQAALQWLHNTWVPGSQPLFLFLYYFDPHTWYNPPSPYDTLYDSTYTGSLTPDRYRDGQDVVAGRVIPTARDIEHLLALYDGEIAYWDYHLGQFMSHLQSIGLLGNSIFVVTSDHGDAFGEHGKWNHTNCVYEEILRVPLLMRYDGIIPGGQAIDVPVQNMDLMPSILDWVGIPTSADLHAVSLRPLVEGQPVASRDIFSEMEGVSDPGHWAYWIAPRGALRSVQRGGWKYIHHVSEPEADELYQLNPTSVYETDNRLMSEPALALELRTAVLEWFGIAPYHTCLPFVAR